MNFFSDSKCERTVKFEDDVESTRFETVKDLFPYHVAFYKNKQGVCHGMVMHESSFQLGHENYSNLYKCSSTTSSLGDCLRNKIPLED